MIQTMEARPYQAIQSLKGIQQLDRLDDQHAVVLIQAESGSARDGLFALRFAADDPASVNPAVLRALLDAGVRVVTLSAEERSLEDAYLSILAEARR